MRSGSRSVGWLGEPPTGWQELAESELASDLGRGDASGELLAGQSPVRFELEVQAEGVLCGVGIAQHLLPGEVLVSDGRPIVRGSVVLRGEGPPHEVLAAERTALNFAMALSGVATLTASYARAVEGTGARIVDTRKTLPGMRTLQKYAVRCGGGHNHRLGLDDGVMLKDNHMRAFGGVTPAIAAARARGRHLLKIEVECDELGQVAEALEAGADVILLDNMELGAMAEAVRLVGGRALLEASGGVSLDTVRAIAETGVDLISVGALTHSAPALAMHLELL